jgi:hypothetical protein
MKSFFVCYELCSMKCCVQCSGQLGRLWDSLQVLPSKEHGYRPAVQAYEVKKDTCVATSTASAQDPLKFGAGGGTQYFLSDYATKLQAVGSRIPLK